MITANELRIGNWVYLPTVGKTFEQQVRWVHSEDVNGFDLSECDPIPLTEEILLKCGFERSGDKYYWNHHGFHCEFDGEDWAIIPSVNSDLVITYLTYLHELQNLYFLICKKELTYTP